MNKKRGLIGVLFLLLASPQTLALFDTVKTGSTGILIYDNNKLLVDFLIFFTLFMALSWVSIRTFYNKPEQKGAATGIAISVSLALAIGAIAAGLSASFSSSFIKYALFFLGIVLVYLLITKLGKIESAWGKFAALLAAAILLWLLFNVGNLFTWEGSLRPSGEGFFDNAQFTVGRLFDVPTRGGSTDLMPFLKWIFCILAGILAYYLIVTIGKIEDIWYKLLVVLAAILIAWLLCLAIGAIGEKKTGSEKSIWDKFTNWVKEVWPFGKGTPDKTPEAPAPEEADAEESSKKTKLTSEVCTPKWTETEWSECKNGKREMTRTDDNGCQDGQIIEESCVSSEQEKTGVIPTPTACTNECSTEGNSCNGDTVQQCYKGGGGCLQIQSTDCNKYNTKDKQYTCGEDNKKEIRCIPKKSSKLWYFGGLGIGILILGGLYFFLRKRGGFGKKPSFKESVDIFKTHTSGSWLPFLQNLKDYTNLLKQIGGGRKP